MKCGAIVERGPTDTVLDQPQHVYTKTLLSAVPRQGWKPVRSRVADDECASEAG
jgi:ABC-type oligopeptide transport system ATPase subunit